MKKSRDSMDEVLVARDGARSSEAQVVGTTQLFSSGGVLRCVPMPTPNPKDPMNLPEWRKWAAIATLSFFGALALSAEAIVGALVPIFVLEYAGIDPKILGSIDISSLNLGSAKMDPIKLLSTLGGPPISKVELISTLPILVNGVASYILVPLSIGIGRRPVLLFSGILAWTGGLWAGMSTSLNSHLAARVFQGFGVGAVEALIPLIIQDMMFINQRNTAISLIGAGQGLFIVSIGLTSPLIITRLSWRWIYYLTGGVGVLAWFMIIFLVPETRWVRTPDELAGKEVYRLRPGETRPRLDYAKYGYRDNKTEFGVFNVKTEWKLAGRSVNETIRATFFPNVLWVIALNSAFVAAISAATQNGAAIILGLGLKFDQLGFVVLPIVVATPFVWLFGGFFADKISNLHARRNGGRREPESHLISLVFPLAAGIVGPMLFAYAGQNADQKPLIFLLVGFFLVGFGGLTMNTLVSVYLIESYPNFAGPVLVTMSSFRLIAGFLLSFKAADWILAMGFIRTFLIYSGTMAGFAVMLPFVYKYGKRMRMWSAGQLEESFGEDRPKEKEMDMYDDGASQRGSTQFVDPRSISRPYDPMRYDGAQPIPQGRAF
ncbi:major facilitator superfamily domain-containing protein [Pseudomassariella vexata]|uniref:Major facilitator superfamily domain-containing protein n=1 Tax=Pseudomassariella vexata TaxID=1141098 RepID=A0A1Y2EHW5_9PEZI|nr:major facilitator superfamily domain-containing protein [Pseudomassariella vexata]ORY70914.1 major facilitator superfamily domain-containing protein [Pseudomassariella vexata]